MADRTITLHAKTTSDGRGLLEAARELERTADGVDELGGKMRATAEDSKRLGRQIEETGKKAHDLRMQIARTGDESLFGDLAREESKLRRLQRLSGNLFPKDGGGGLLSSIPRIGGVPGPLIAGGGAAAAALSPAIGATIAAAVLGGVGTGGLIGGVALASQDTRVKAAFKDFGQEAFRGLSDAASPLVEPLVGAASTFGDAWRKELPRVQQDFKILAETVDPLAKGVAGFVHQLHPGLTTALKASVPLAEQFGEEFEGFGTATGEFLRDMARAAPGAKVALHDLFTVIDGGLEILGDGTKILSGTYEGMRKLGLVAPPEWLMQASSGALPTALELLNPELEKATNNLKDMHTPTEELARAHEDAADAAKKQKDALEKLNKRVEDYFDSISSRRGAAREWEAAWDDLTEAVKENGRTLDITNEKGRANEEALERVAEAARGLLETGQITEAQYLRRIELIEIEAAKLKLPQAAVAALLAEYKKVPTQIKTDIALNAVGEGWKLLRFLLTGKPLGPSSVTVPVTTAGRAPTVGAISHQAFLDLPTRDSGGPVASGKSYLIGGKTGPPEILTMGSMGGHVTPTTGRTGITFAGDTDSAFATAFMKLVRNGQITITSEP